MAEGDCKIAADVSKNGVEKENKLEAEVDVSKESPQEKGDSKDNTADGDLAKRIIKQVEYYFGDINLSKDKFMKEEIKKDEGWISMETMLNFKRLNVLSSCPEIICAALQNSELMEVAEDNSKIRRCPDVALKEWTSEVKLERRTRTVYAKGFPLNATIDDIEPLFEKFGEVESIQFRKDKNKIFKGSVFVMFKTVETAHKFAETTDQKFKEMDLKVATQMDYFRRKLGQKSDTVKARAEEKEKKQHENEASRINREEEETKKRMTKGAILHIKGLPDDTNRDKVKEGLAPYGKVAWVDMIADDKEAKVRFDGENSAQAAVDKSKEQNDGKFRALETDLDYVVLEGDEEFKHWSEVYKIQRERRDNKRGSGGGRGRGRGKRRGGGGRFGGERGPANKKKKFDDDEGGDDD